MTVLALLATMGASPAHAQPTPPNVVPLTAETPHGGFNRLTVTVTVCRPGTTTCATIDHVMVDTGSVGLRLQASAATAALGLPAARDPDGHPVAQCLRFIGNAAWGAVHRADVRIGGMLAPDIPVQVVGTAIPREPSCPDAGHPTSNGTLGVGTRPADCDGECVNGVAHPLYYACAAAECRPVAGPVPPALRVANPVFHFGAHDNGLMFDLPLPAHRGAPQARGRLVFGVGTSPDNALDDARGDARVLRLSRTGRFTTTFDGADYPDSYIDSGTEYVSVPGAPWPRCRPGGAAICQDPTRSATATVTGADGARLPLPFLVGRFPGPGERGVFAAAVSAAPPDSRAFVWGAPFFMGRRVFLVFRDKPVPGRPGLLGPFYATTPARPPGP